MFDTYIYIFLFPVRVYLHGLLPRAEPAGQAAGDGEQCRQDQLGGAAAGAEGPAQLRHPACPREVALVLARPPLRGTLPHLRPRLHQGREELEAAVLDLAKNLI